MRTVRMRQIAAPRVNPGACSNNTLNATIIKDRAGTPPRMSPFMAPGCLTGLPRIRLVVISLFRLA